MLVVFAVNSGGVSLITSGVVQFFLRKPALDTLKRECTKIPGSGDYDCAGAPPDQVGDLKNKADALPTYDIVVPVTLGVGVAAVGAGVTLYLLDRKNAQEAAESATLDRISVRAAAPGADLGGVSLSGSF